MLFGHKEIVEFAKDHEDERVRIMLKRYQESRKKAAQWAGHAMRVKERIKEVKEFAEGHHSQEPGHVIFHGLTVDVVDQLEKIIKS